MTHIQITIFSEIMKSINENIIKPYVKAIFDIAKFNGNIDLWIKFLVFSNNIYESINCLDQIKNKKSIEIYFIKFLKDNFTSINKHQENFIRILFQNNRIEFISDILLLFKKYKYIDSGVEDIKITSAFELSELEKIKICSSMENFFSKKINSTYYIDSSLIGGLIISSSNITIDGSIKSIIKKMYYEISKN